MAGIKTSDIHAVELASTGESKLTHRWMRVSLFSSMEAAGAAACFAAACFAAAGGMSAIGLSLTGMAAIALSTPVLAVAGTALLAGGLYGLYKKKDIVDTLGRSAVYEARDSRRQGVPWGKIVNNLK